MLKIKPVRGALALLLAVSLCLAMSLTAFLIDTPAMREHAEQAVDLLGYESASPEIVGGFASSRLDNYTAVLILKTAAYIGDDPLLRMAFSGLRTDLPPQEDQTDWEAYATYSDAVPSPNNVPYSRYWHGYTFALRLLLCLFTFTNLQMLLLFAQTALLLWTVLLMVWRGLQQLIPAFAVSWFFMSPPALGLCLQYAPVSLIALLACSLLLALKPALSRSVGLPVFFALIGLFVNYFDLLTFPRRFAQLPADSPDCAGDENDDFLRRPDAGGSPVLRRLGARLCLHVDAEMGAQLSRAGAGRNRRRRRPNLPPAVRGRRIPLPAGYPAAQHPHRDG